MRVGSEIPAAVLDDASVIPVFGIFGTVEPFQPPLITLETDTDSKNYTLGVGHYFGPRTTLDLSYARSEADADTRSISCIDDDLPANIFNDFSSALQCFTSTQVTRAETETDSLQVTVKHLRQVAHIPLALRGSIAYLKSSTETELRFSNSFIAVAVDPAIIDFGFIIDAIPFNGALAFPEPTSFTDDGWSTAVDITLYPRKNLSVTVAYDYADIEDRQTKTHGVAMEWFITRSFAASLSYMNTDFDNNFGNSDSVALQLSGRF
ncbi:MAG: hypothetical protein ACR2P1_17815 [Pseudomonadales bacterium]